MGSIGCPLCCRHEFISVVALHDHLLYYMYRPLQCAICSIHVGGIQELTHHLERHLGDGVSTVAYHPVLPSQQKTDSENIPFIENKNSASYDYDDKNRLKSVHDKKEKMCHQTREEPIELTLRAFFCQTCGEKIVGKDSYFLHIKQHISNPNNHASNKPLSPRGLYQQETSFAPSPSLASTNTMPSNTLTDSETVTTEETHETTVSPKVQLSECQEEEHVANQLLKLREWQLGKHGRRFRKHHLSFSSSPRAIDHSPVGEKLISTNSTMNTGPDSVKKISQSHTRDTASTDQVSVESEQQPSLLWPSSVSCLSEGFGNTEEIPGPFSLPSTSLPLVNSSEKTDDSAVYSKTVLSPCNNVTPTEQNEYVLHGSEYVELDDCVVSPLDSINESFHSNSVREENVEKFSSLELETMSGRDSSQYLVSQSEIGPDVDKICPGLSKPPYNDNNSQVLEQNSQYSNPEISNAHIPFSLDSECLDALKDNYQLSFENVHDISNSSRVTDQGKENISETSANTENLTHLDKIAKNAQATSTNNLLACEDTVKCNFEGDKNKDQEPYLHKKFHHDQERKVVQTTGITQTADVNRYIQSIQSLLVNKLNGTLNSEVPFKSERLSLKAKTPVKNVIKVSNCSTKPNTSPRVYMCEVCNFKCPNQVTYAAHCKSHEVEGQKNFVCQYCSKKFYRKRSRDLHIRKHTGEKLHQCTACPKLFTKFYALKRHKDEVHSSRKQFVCAECSKEFASQRQLEAHLDIHHSEKSHKCNQCKHACHTASGLRTHKLYIHSNDQKREKYQCQECKYVFKKNSGLKRHMQRKHSTEILKCELCSKVYSCSQDLMQHRKIHSNELYKCKHCEKSFTSSWSLQRHNVIHKTKTHPFQCDKCSTKFTRLDSLKCHLNIHSQKKPYVCHCGKRFVKKSQLKSHEDKHSDIAKYICNVCGHSFKFKVSLKNHSCKQTCINEESIVTSSS